MNSDGDVHKYQVESQDLHDGLYVEVAQVCSQVLTEVIHSRRPVIGHQAVLGSYQPITGRFLHSIFRAAKPPPVRS